MAITLQERQSSKSSNAHTKGYSRTQRNATNDDRGVQYRQLVSRAVTQRLHSPSLDDLTKTDVANKLAHPLKTWETQERSIARDKARVEAKMLDIPWSKTTFPLTCIPTLHTDSDMQIELTDDSKVYPRCRERYPLSPCPHANTIRSTLRGQDQEPRSEHEKRRSFIQIRRFEGYG